DKPLEYGGFLALNDYVKKIDKETAGNYLLFDAGDFMTGNPICDIEVGGAKGGAMIWFMNYVGYHGATVGNHEFDISVDNCKRLIGLSDFLMISSNLFTADGKLFADKPYHIYEKNNLKIGVIGVMVHELAGYLNAEQQQQVYTRPQADIVQSIADKIDDETDLIVVLSHAGIEQDSYLAKQLDDRVDIIIGGHSHTKLNEARIINGKILFQAGSKLIYLGRLDVTVAADTVRDFQSDLMFLDATHIQKDPVLEAEINKYTKLIDERYGRVIGNLSTPWKRNSRGESNLGNFLTDCMREFTGADFAVLNSGGIRAGLPKGDIRAIDIKEILPFTNPVCHFEMNGTGIMKILKTNAEATAERSFGILQVSGVEYHWTTDEAGDAVITRVTIAGEKLDPEKIYKVATVDYVLANDEKYFGMNVDDFTNMGTPIADVVIKAIENKGKIDSRIEGRIVKE
ncbi:hypothetical protein GF337_10220, partial [candidate division KSB1 bacterium]|nr:hypothetical protein [candidate division KSB1 bacterium]